MIETGGTVAETVTVNVLVAVSFGEEESVTCRVNVEDPVAVGVPESLPLLLMVKPAGNVPEDTVQEYGVTPPDAATVVE